MCNAEAHTTESSTFHKSKLDIRIVGYLNKGFGIEACNSRRILWSARPQEVFFFMTKIKIKLLIEWNTFLFCFFFLIKRSSVINGRLLLSQFCYVFTLFYCYTDYSSTTFLVHRILFSSNNKKKKWICKYAIKSLGRPNLGVYDKKKKC